MVHDKEIEKIISKIQAIQSKPYVNWLSAWSNKIQVNQLHKQLDRMHYTGDRPPRFWNQRISKLN